MNGLMAILSSFSTFCNYYYQCLVCKVGRKKWTRVGFYCWNDGKWKKSEECEDKLFLQEGNVCRLCSFCSMFSNLL